MENLLLWSPLFSTQTIQVEIDQNNLIVGTLSIIAGLPKRENTKLHNIHFVLSSNTVSVLQQAAPMAEELSLVEEKGVEAYDADRKKSVLLVAPVICCICDNPWAAEISNHLGTTANKFCRMCMVGAVYHTQNELCFVNIIGRSTPVQTIHSVPLGSYKYIFRAIMGRLSAKQKEEVAARISSFNFSGFKVNQDYPPPQVICWTALQGICPVIVVLIWRLSNCCRKTGFTMGHALG